MSTIKTTITTGITIGTDGYTSPLKITAAGYVGTDNGGIFPIYSQSVATVVNAGIIRVNPLDFTDMFDIYLKAGGSVVNKSRGTISGSLGIAIDGVGTVVNAGVIGGDNSGTDDAIQLISGSVTNQTGGIISGSAIAILAAGTAVVVNAGSISASVDFGVDLAGGSVTNQAGGIISAYEAGVYIGQGTVVNAGTISGSRTHYGYGVLLNAGGSVTNLAGGMISGFLGIAARAAATVVNAGTISGIGDAVQFAGGNTNRLVIDPGATFTGTVDGGNALGASSISTLELGFGASAGTLTGLGSQFVNFGSIAFDSGADWFIEGSTAGLAGSISGFAAGDTIDIDGITATGSSYAGGVLTLDEASGSASLNLVGDFSTNEFVVTNIAGGAEVTALCFCANTLIETPAGARKVQDLVVGDLVVTFGGTVRPIAWVGTGAVLATRGRRGAATPVIVRKGALADNVPYQDLHVTKGHSLLVDNVLIPVEFLVNHRSILWDDRAQEVKLYHIELETHDVLVANGAPAESYRDDGNRWLFQNANAGWNQPAKPPCAPVLTGGPIVDAIWRRLLDRAGPRDLPPTTDDPDLHLVVDSRRVDAVRRHGITLVFRLPARPDHARIVSRDVVPAELGLARDPRTLGVALRRIVVRQGAKFAITEAADERLTEGFHGYEPAGTLRWTNGDATLPAGAFDRFIGPLEIVLTLAGATTYPDHGKTAA